MQNFSLLAASVFVVAIMLLGSTDLRPCASPTDTWCYWDAQAHGGTESFMVLWEARQ